ncbi:hypothetical protein HD553DRAFT_316654 [Filobasidium floriforme]|uniref:uncharacterized protein n=1 Tax=Filobasidium floriforme TaxID=5210 RepID=UPI001E8E50E5|nr:uncharacterized protein HD553DRAFT_316654 [Filobasidium floriforme]KAH8080902.1 hypothetical protein HD553DRAFT_316654 [Filobasidium floriforme]
MSNNPLRRPATSPSDNLAGRLAMTIGRALDPTLAYALLRNGVAGKLLQTIGLKRIITLPLVTRVGLNTDFFGAGLLDKPGNMLLTMNAITALRHIWWANAECSSEFPVSAGAFVSGFNSLYTVINSLVFVYRVSRGKTNPLASNWMQYLGFLAVVVGNVGEIVIESSRRAFKNDKRNAGKVYDQGAWGVVRHPNYAFYTLHRVGTALATGSILNATLTFLFQNGIFALSSIPDFSSHMASKYKEQWAAYTKRVPYVLIPYVY